MSDFKVSKYLDQDGFWVELEDRDETSAVNMDSETSKPQSYYCSLGSHEWKWYEGFYMDRFWYCASCDHKDHDMPPPPNRK